MKKLVTLCLIGFLSVTCLAAEVSGSASVDFVSKYIWRGFNLSDGFNIQPGVSVSGGGFTLGYWGSSNYEAEDYNIEQDFYMGYDISLMDEALGLSLGYTYYKFPSLGEDESHEFWLGLTANNLFLSPSVTVYVDVGDEEDGGADGQYVLLSGSKDFSLSDSVTLGLGIGVGYNNELFIDEKGFADLSPSISLTYNANEHLSLGMSAHYVTIIDSDVEESMGADDEFWGGIHVSVS